MAFSGLQILLTLSQWWILVCPLPAMDLMPGNSGIKELTAVFKSTSAG